MSINSFEDFPMSWKPVIDQGAKPVYRFLANQLEQDIMKGLLLPGTRLPPQRELADFLDINVSTVSKAFKVCELKGLLSATVGSGTFVSFDALSNAYLLSDRKTPNVIELGATLPEPGSYESLAVQLRSMVNEADIVKWFGYSRPNDMLWQKDAAVKLMERGGYDTEIDSILFSNGGQNAITAALAGLCKHGDKVGADPHTYPGLKTAAAMLGIQLVPIRQRDREMDEHALADACRNENLKGIYLIPDHHNPSTHRMSLTRRKALAKVVREQNIFIIEDATYHLMCPKRVPAVATFAPDQTIHIASLSKTAAPGLRLAYVSVPERYRKSLSNALYNINISVSPLMAELAARMIVSGNIDTIIESHRKNTIARNRRVNQLLSNYHCHGDETSIFRWIQLPAGISGASFESLALERGVQVYAAERFTVGNSLPENAVRMSVCAPETIAELESGLVILEKLLKTLS